MSVSDKIIHINQVIFNLGSSWGKSNSIFWKSRITVLSLFHSWDSLEFLFFWNQSTPADNIWLNAANFSAIAKVQQVHKCPVDMSQQLYYINEYRKKMFLTFNPFRKTPYSFCCNGYTVMVFLLSSLCVILSSCSLYIYVSMSVCLSG